jgi:hypothetical protein
LPLPTAIAYSRTGSDPRRTVNVLVLSRAVSANPSVGIGVDRVADISMMIGIAARGSTERTTRNSDRRSGRPLDVTFFETGMFRLLRVRRASCRGAHTARTDIQCWPSRHHST